MPRTPPGRTRMGIGWTSALPPHVTITRRWFGPLGFSASIALIVAMAFLGYPKLRDFAPFAEQPGASDPPALLRVDQQGADLRISWNRSAAAISRAKAGLLSIWDGNNVTQQLHLAADQLRTGSLLYTPSTNQVQLRLDLREPDGHDVSESLLALSASRSTVQGNETAPDAAVLHSPTAVVARHSTPIGLGQSPAITGRLSPGQVVHQAQPDVSRKARDTIHGTVRVRVRVLVDPSGGVVGAGLDSPGPSRYFAERTLEAARRCRFTPAKVDGRNVSSEWVLRFEFGRTETRFFPARVSP
jgi:TonB family protein